MKRGVNQQRANTKQQQSPVASQSDARRPRQNLSESMTDRPRWDYELNEHCRREGSGDNEDDLDVRRDQLVLPIGTYQITLAPLGAVR